jgi:hypothetical protein
MPKSGGGLRFVGSFTTDGAGAATVNLTVPARTDGRVRRVTRAEIGNASATPMTGGTATLKDNAGAGQTILTYTQATDGTRKSLTAPVSTIVGNLRITVAGGGASKNGEYFIELD